VKGGILEGAEESLVKKKCGGREKVIEQSYRGIGTQ
jgi:hypothetical protein